VPRDAREPLEGPLHELIVRAVEHAGQAVADMARN
jgi:hypothetical protein